MNLSDEARPYFDAFLAFERDYQPEWIATEVVAVVPDLGVAGTIDAIARFGSKTVILDWKTRGKRHGAYADEAAQLGVYSWAKHLIVGAHPGEQIPMPDIDELAIVSLAPDGSYALFPIDRDKARSAAQHMHSAYAQQRLLDELGQQAIGAPVVSAPAAAPDRDPILEQRVEWLRGRIADLTPAARVEAGKTWPNDTPRKANRICSHTEVDAIAACLDAVEAAHEIPFGQPDPTLPPLEPGALSARRRHDRSRPVGRAHQQEGNSQHVTSN